MCMGSWFYARVQRNAWNITLKLYYFSVVDPYNFDLDPDLYLYLDQGKADLCLDLDQTFIIYII